MFRFPFLNSNVDLSSTRELRDWRTRILDGILRGVFVLWLFALAGGINNVLDAYRNEAYLYQNPLAMASSVIAIYLGTTAILAYITFNRKIKLEWRAGLLLFVFYALGTIGMALSSFSGDGRIFFFAFIILSAVFFDLRYSLTAFIFTFLTLVLLGWLQVSGILFVPAERQVNSTDAGAWISGGIVLLVLSIAALISVTYLLRVLEQSLTGMRLSLEREKRLSQILRTVSEINQLIVRAQDPGKMLSEACELLISGQGYDFAWVGLLGPDNVTIKLAAHAGDVVDENKFNFRMDREENSLACIVQAIRMRAFFRVEPAESDDPCSTCPRKSKYPNRSAVAFPLLRDDRALGVLVVDHIEPSAVFDQQEVTLLQELTDDLAFALEKLEMNNRLLANTRYKTLLSDVISNALETTDSKSLLQTTADRMREVYNADACYIVSWDEDRQAPLPAAASGFLQDFFFQLYITPEDEVQTTKLLFETGETLLAEDAGSDPRVNTRLAGLLHVRSLMGLPLMTGERRHGGIFLTYQEPHHFTQEEVTFGGQVAGQISLALERIRLHGETQAKAAELERLYAAAQDMAASIMDPPELLAKLAHHMTEALEATSGNIMAVNLADATMQVVAEYWAHEASPTEIHSDLGRVYPIDEYATIMSVMQNGEVIIMHWDGEAMTSIEREQFTEYGIKSMMFVPIMAHGQLFGNIEIWESRRRREFTQADIRLARAMAGHAASIIENANLVNALRSSETRYRTLVEQASDGIFLANSERQYVDVNPSGCAMLGYSREELLAMRMEDLTFSDDLSTVPFRLDDLRAGKILIVERLLKRKDGSPIPVEISAKMLPNGYLQGIVRDISERKRAEKALAEREAYFRALIENSTEGVAIIDAQGTVRYLAPSEERLTGYTPEEIVGKSAFQYIHPQDLPKVLQTFSEGVATPGAVRTVEYRLQRKDGQWRHFEIIGHNMLDDPHIAGVVVNYRDITERKRAEEASQRHTAELEALAGVSTTLRAASNLAEMIPLITRHAAKAVHAANGSIFLLDTESGDLFSSGWYDAEQDRDVLLDSESALRHRIGEGITGHVAQSGETYFTDELQSDPVTIVLPLEAERLSRIHSGLSLPLRAHNKVVGVLHVWLDERRVFTETEMRLLTAIAEMAGNAIHRVSLFEQTLQHAQELTLAYDNTLAGWARALELRDELTEGHTRRVTELTLQLARALHVPENEIIHIRRGALLHDIGKMGIPDSILHKPGAFTAQERKIMQQHPQYACDMLSSIPFLQAALDIPYSHHEHWDGEGYPRGLKGEEIPLSARIFSIIDVWDALTSDRPYRKAWSKKKTRDYIFERAGKQFDPHLVEVFFSVVLD